MDRLNRYDKGFIRGVFLSASWMVRSYDEPTMALDLLRDNGFKMADAVAAECDPYDLEWLKNEDFK